jgi:hypothetical protein
MVLDVNEAEQNRVVDVGNALSSSAESRAQERRSVMEFDAIHLRTDGLGEAVVSRRFCVEGAESEAGNPFVDLLRNERDVEKELEGRNIEFASSWVLSRTTHLVLLAQERSPVLLNVELSLADQICDPQRPISSFLPCSWLLPLTRLLGEHDGRAPPALFERLVQPRNDDPVPFRISDEFNGATIDETHLASMMKIARQILGDCPVCE